VGAGAGEGGRRVRVKTNQLDPTQPLRRRSRKSIATADFAPLLSLPPGPSNGEVGWKGAVRRPWQVSSAYAPETDLQVRDFKRNLPFASAMRSCL
jgi:hypothetical protein